jgi:hypothetical protein
MIPGRASGSTTTNETTSRPKNRNRCTAKDAAVPSTNAMAVAISPALIERRKASRTSGSFHVSGNHLKVNPGSGQLWMVDVLNAYSMMMRMGTNRNAKTRTTQIRRARRVHAVSTVTSPRRRRGASPRAGTHP